MREKTGQTFLIVLLLAMAGSTMVYAVPVTSGLRVWTDAQDASTLDLDAYNGAWAWNDKANGAGYGDSNNDKWWTPSAPNLPRYVTDAWGPGKNVLRFDGVDDGMNNSFLGNLGIDDVTGGFTIFVVARNMDTVAYAPVLNSYYDWKYNISIDNDSGVVLRAHEGAVDYNASVDSAVTMFPRIRVISYNNKTVEAFENGASLGTGTWDTVPPDTASFGTNATMRLGYQGYVVQHGAVEVGEVLIYDRQLTAEEQKQVYDYLVQKWGQDSSLPVVDGLRVWTDVQDANTLQLLSGSSYVTNWFDKAVGIGYGDSRNDAWVANSNTNTVDKPQLVADAWGGGLDAIRFDGDLDRLKGSTLGNLGIEAVTGEFTIFAVARNMDSGANDLVFSSYYDWKYNISMDNDSGVLLRAHEGGTNYNASVASSVSTLPRVRVISYNNKTVEAIEDGISLGTGTWDTVPPDTASFASSASMYLAHAAFVNAYSDVEIGEILIYDRQLTAAEQNEVGYYLEQRWGLDTAYTMPPAPSDPPSIVDFGPSGNVMKMVVHLPGAPIYYAPRASTDLAVGAWTNVPHSTNGLDGFVVSNFSYSASEGTNEVIYVQADDASKFFKIVVE